VSGDALCFRGIKVGNFEYVEKPLSLGATKGNRFEVTLRALSGATPQQVADAATALRAFGFVNYFGLQRFGSGSVANHR
jgi:tRNA pseudouridine13 synthase